MAQQPEIDPMLRLIENPIRRKIIKRLSQEPTYPLELAKEIGAAQQLVSSHLAILEKAGIVGSSFSESPIGPSRRSYFLKDSVYLSLSFGPNLFSEQSFTFEALPKQLSNQATDFMSRISNIAVNPQDKIGSLSRIIKDVDKKLDEIETEKIVLLFIRNLAMKHASEQLTAKHDNHEERRMLHYMLDERCVNVQEISDALNLKESSVRILLEKLKNEIPL